MKATALIILGLWVAGVSLAIYGSGVGAVMRGLSFELNERDSALLSWMIVVGMPLVSAFLYFMAERQRR